MLRSPDREHWQRPSSGRARRERLLLLHCTEPQLAVQNAGRIIMHYAETTKTKRTSSLLLALTGCGSSLGHAAARECILALTMFAMRATSFSAFILLDTFHRPHAFLTHPLPCARDTCMASTPHQASCTVAVQGDA